MTERYRVIQWATGSIGRSASSSSPATHASNWSACYVTSDDKAGTRRRRARGDRPARRGRDHRQGRDPRPRRRLRALRAAVRRPRRHVRASSSRARTSSPPSASCSPTRRDPTRWPAPAPRARRATARCTAPASIRASRATCCPSRWRGSASHRADHRAGGGRSAPSPVDRRWTSTASASVVTPTTPAPTRARWS